MQQSQVHGDVLSKAIGPQNIQHSPQIFNCPLALYVVGRRSVQRLLTAEQSRKLKQCVADAGWQRQLGEGVLKLNAVLVVDERPYALFLAVA